VRGPNGVVRIDDIQKLRELWALVQDRVLLSDELLIFG
jgi:hypothetical protein